MIAAVAGQVDYSLDEVWMFLKFYLQGDSSVLGLKCMFT